MLNAFFSLVCLKIQSTLAAIFPFSRLVQLKYTCFFSFLSFCSQKIQFTGISIPLVTNWGNNRTLKIIHQLPNAWFNLPLLSYTWGCLKLKQLPGVTPNLRLSTSACCSPSVLCLLGDPPHLHLAVELWVKVSHPLIRYYSSMAANSEASPVFQKDALFEFSGLPLCLII